MNSGRNSRPDLVLIMPVYNEEGCLEEVVAEIRQGVLDRIPGAQLFVVDDGSADRGPAILDRLAKADPQIVVAHKPNGGHGDALLFGLARAGGEYLFLLDSDRQIPVEDFGLLWEKRGPNVFVCGVRSNRRDPLHRLALTRIVRLAIWLLFGKRMRDANAPFKLFHRSVWQRLAPLLPAGALTPSLLLAVAAASDPKTDFREVVVRHRPRASGVTVLRAGRLLRFCWRAFLQMLEFRKNVKAWSRT